MASKERLSYWQVFRLIFVIFSLYLMGDAFFRWDGFRYHSTFIEFLPTVALITVLWTIIALFTALLVWLAVKVVVWLCLHIGWKIKVEHWVLFIGIFVLLGVAVWIGKKLMWHYVQATLQLKLIVFLCVTLGSIFLTWLFRKNSERWMGIIQERITPLVWLFGILVAFSMPLVAYYTWGKQEVNTVSQKIPRFSVTDKSRPNIILVTFDALTARDMSVYGYHRPTTPFITEWANSAFLFTGLEADSNWTDSTTASLMTGKREWTHQRYHESSEPVKSDIENLALLLKNNGYYNMAFVVNPHASVEGLGIADSFEIAPLEIELWAPASLYGRIDAILYRFFGNQIKLHNWLITEDFILNNFLRAIYPNFFEFSKTEVPPEKAFKRFLAVVDENLPEPFFAWIHVFPPHNPYLPPETHMGVFDSSSELKTSRSQTRVMLGIGRGRKFKQENQATIDIMRARYDEFIMYCDKQFEDFIAQLTTRSKLKNTVIILSSDHGESFEHNYLTHGSKHLYEQVTHIPFIIKEPNQIDGQIINDLVEQIDIPATILSLANIPVPSWMEGRSLVPLMRGKKFSSRPAFSMNLQSNLAREHQITKGTIAVWEGNYKLIHYLEEKKSLLFNLKQDPDELNNLFDKEPEVGQRLLALIQENLKKANQRISKDK